MALYRFGPVCNLIWLTQNLLDSYPSEFESRILYHIFTIVASYLFHVRLTRILMQDQTKNGKVLDFILLIVAFL